jgi:DNA-binding CsgD family transcriptional regulator
LAGLPAGSEEVDDELADELLNLLLIAAASTPAMADGAMRRLLTMMDDLSKGHLPRQPAARAVLASTLAAVGRPAAEVRPVAEAALAGASLVHDPFGATFGLVAVALLIADELEFVVEAAQAAAARARERGSMTAVASAIHWRSAAQCLMGQLEDAARGLEQAVWLGRAGWKGLVGWNTYYLARSYIELGEFERAESAIAAGLELHHEHPLGRAIMFEVRGRLALARRQYERALEDLLQSGAQLSLPEHHIPAIFAWRPLAAMAARILGEHDRAEAWIREELEAVSGRFTARTRATVLRAGGVVLGGEAGIEMLEQSVALLEGSPAALELAHSRVELGAALRRGGLRVRAREQLRGGLALAVGFAAAPLADRARQELAASGARLRREADSGRAALTPAERRVAELAAQGLSVPEVGRQLVLSRKTVEWHLGRVYRKLGVHSRAEFYAAWRSDDSP